MSSIGSATSSTRSQEPITVEYNGPNQYVLNGKEASEAEVNRALAGRGITASQGMFRTSDGFELNSTNQNAVTLSGSAPLPNVAGPMAGNELVGQKAGWLTEISDGALMWHAMSTLAHTAELDMKSSKELKNAMEQQKIQMKQAQINATESQIAAERKAATEQLVFSLVAVAASAAGGAWGGTAIQGASQAIGGAVTAAGQAYSKNMGAQREADEKKLEVKRLEREEAMIDQAVDTAKSNYEESRELFKNALKAISEHVERQTQVVQKITS
jgi:hypothetical protein